jgi:hypothetical protein
MFTQQTLSYIYTMFIFTQKAWVTSTSYSCIRTKPCVRSTSCSCLHKKPWVTSTSCSCLHKNPELHLHHVYVYTKTLSYITSCSCLHKKPCVKSTSCSCLHKKPCITSTSCSCLHKKTCVTSTSCSCLHKKTLHYIYIMFINKQQFSVLSRKAMDCSVWVRQWRVVICRAAIKLPEMSHTIPDKLPKNIIPIFTWTLCITSHVAIP